MSSDSEDNGHRNPFRSDDEDDEEEEDDENMEEFQSQHAAQKNNRRRTQQKTENLYGIFGDLSSDEEGKGRGKRNKRRGNEKKQQKYGPGPGAPVTFVGFTGKQLSSEDAQKGEGDDSKRSLDIPQTKEEMDETEQQFRQLIGGTSLGAQGSGGVGNGVNRNQDFRNLVNTAAQLAQEAEATAAAVAANRAASTVIPPPVNLAKVGQWEKHTKGFGKKMLEKMGFKGRLGARETGISAAVEVKVRPEQMGLGFGDFVESTMLEVRRASFVFSSLMFLRTTKNLRQSC